MEERTSFVLFSASISQTTRRLQHISPMRLLACTQASLVSYAGGRPRGTPIGLYRIEGPTGYYFVKDVVFSNEKWQFKVSLLNPTPSFEFFHILFQDHFWSNICCITYYFFALSPYWTLGFPLPLPTQCIHFPIWFRIFFSRNHCSSDVPFLSFFCILHLPLFEWLTICQRFPSVLVESSISPTWYACDMFAEILFHPHPQDKILCCLLYKPSNPKVNCFLLASMCAALVEVALRFPAFFNARKHRNRIVGLVQPFGIEF